MGDAAAYRLATRAGGPRRSCATTPPLRCCVQARRKSETAANGSTPRRPTARCAASHPPRRAHTESWRRPWAEAIVKCPGSWRMALLRPRSQISVASWMPRRRQDAIEKEIGECRCTHLLTPADISVEDDGDGSGSEEGNAE